MNYFADFFHQKVPKTGREMPSYYRRALITCEALLAGYFFLMGLLLAWRCQVVLWVPFALSAASLIALNSIRKMHMRMNLCVYALITCYWCLWYVRVIGWSNGAQPLMFTLLLLLFFNVCEGPWVKIVCFAVLVAYRMTLYAYGLNHAPQYIIDHSTSIILQTVNTITVYMMLACICILFSTNIQDAERQLRLDNQELHKEAGTDPLTQLPNRRAMLDEMNRFMRESPHEYFCVAIADIDYFKNVNDTYGHPCGDYTLCKLADLFREKAGIKYKACRWGGEEFCFLLPGMNMDAAGREMIDLNIAVRRMKLNFEDAEFSITITIGVEEYDFRSPIEDILESADRKLYMGKERGRDQVVM